MLLLLLLFLLTVALCAGCALALHRLTGGSVGRTVFRAGWPLAVSVCQLPFLARSFAPAVLKPLAGLLPAMALVLCAAQACFVLQRRIKRHPAFLPAAGLALLCLFLECFPFQINFWASRSYAPTELLAQPVSITADSQTLTLHFSPLTAHNLYITYTGSPEQSVCAQVTYRESAFPGRDFTLGDTWQLYAQNENSRCLNLHLDGELTALQLEFAAGCEITVTGIQVNRPRPFDFSPVRVLCMLVLAGLFWFLRPGSSAWTTAYLERTRAQKWVCRGICGGIALLFFLLAYATPLCCHLRIRGLNQEGGSLIGWESDTGSDASLQYELLAEALAHGSTALEIEPEPALTALENPYDVDARTASGANYIWDSVYYQGHFYVYFGVVPVLLFYLPVYLLTGHHIDTATVCLAVGLLFILGCALLLRAVLRRWFPKASTAAWLIGMLAAVFLGGMPGLLGRPDIYEIAIACAVMFTVWGFSLWITASRPCSHRRLLLLAGSTCLALVAGCRPQVTLLSVLMLPLFGREYLLEKKLFSKKGAADFAIALLPYILAAAGLMAYNYVRFGSPFEFGANYNLTSLDMTGRALQPGRIPQAVWNYLLASPIYIPIFPFLEGRLQTAFHGFTAGDAVYGGLYAARPLLLFTAALFFCRRQIHTKKLGGVLVCWLTVPAVILCIDVLMTDMNLRYSADFSTPLILAAILGLWLAEELVPAGRAALLLRSGTAISLAVSLAHSLLVLLQSQSPWLESNPMLYFNLQQMLMFWR